MEILWITLCTPFDGVSHAGGKTANFYQSYFSKDKSVHIKLVTFCSEEEKRFFDTKRYQSGIEFIVVPKGIKKIVWNFQSLNSKINPFYQYGDAVSGRLAREMLKRLKNIKHAGYKPDVVILEWTAVVLYADAVRVLFPDAKFAAVEHDVTFQAYQREAVEEQLGAARKYKSLRAANMMKRELSALDVCDLILVQNEKDKKLLLNHKIQNKKIKQIVPYYHRSKREHSVLNHNIIFYGYMKRKENITAVRWFARHVMPLLSGLDCEFMILGKGGEETVADLESDKVHVIGYVESIDKWFAEGMCFAAPLRLGAGIKVKCIEALYAGIPVLTNHIGIEGIPAKDGTDYYYCQTAADYARVIRQLYASDIAAANGRNVIEKGFQLERSAAFYLNLIKSLV